MKHNRSFPQKLALGRNFCNRIKEQEHLKKKLQMCTHAHHFTTTLWKKQLQTLLNALKNLDAMLQKKKITATLVLDELQRLAQMPGSELSRH